MTLLDDYEVHEDSGNLRRSVFKFAWAMEMKLRESDGKKGSEGWKSCHLKYLKRRLNEEVAEFMKTPCVSEAVDVANIAMMCVDNHQGAMIAEIITKCEQYWNEPIISNPEMRSILEFIHVRARQL